MKITGQKHFSQRTSVFVLISLFTQHQCKANLNRSPVIQLFLLSVTFSAHIVSGNFLFAREDTSSVCGDSTAIPWIPSLLLHKQRERCTTHARTCKSCCPCALVNALGRPKAFHNKKEESGPTQMSTEKLERVCGSYRNGVAECRLPLHAWHLQEGFSCSWHCVVQVAVASCKEALNNCQDSHRLHVVDKALDSVSINQARISIQS